MPSRTSSGFKGEPHSPLVLIALSLWVGALAAGLIGPWGALLAPLAFIKRWRWAVTVALLGAALFLLRVHEVHADPLESKSVGVFVATLNSSFSPTHQRVNGSYLSAKEFSAAATLTTFGQYSTHIPVRLISKSFFNGTTSEVVAGSGRIISATDQSLGGVLLAQSLRSIRPANIAQRFAAKFRSNFLAVASKFQGDSSALIPGMVLGDTSLQSDGFTQSMQRAGLTHLTAVSGENFAIIALFTLALLKRAIPRRFGLRYLLLAAILICFVVVVGPSPSVLRASVMTSTLVLGKVRGVRSHSLNSLALAVAILLILNPFQAKSFGFALSVAATAGIIIFAEPLERKLPQVIAIPLAATIACTPIIVLLSGQLSWSSLPANILASIAVTPVTILGLISALFANVSVTLGEVIFSGTQPFAWWITAVARVAASNTLLYLPKTVIGAAIPIAFAVAIIKKKRWLIYLLILAVAAAIFTPRSFWPGEHWLLVNCDVGQGDGLVLRTAKHSAIVIDVGPDPDLMDACLQRLHINQIPLLILTHFHADHVTGLAKVLRGRSVGKIWVSHFHEPLSEYAIVMSQLRGRQVERVTPGESFTVGPADIEVLASGDGSTMAPVTGTTINNSSIAVIIKEGAFSLFAGGDIEPEAQELILASHRVSKVDVLKVSHHGSRNQYLPLLDALAPKVAFISVGKGNMYGHPSPTLLRELAKQGVKTYRTDLDGALALDASLHERSLKVQWWSVHLK